MSLTAVGTEAVETEKLISSIDTLKSYKYGSSGGVDLRWVETQVGMASKDPSIRGQIEQRLIDSLAAATTNDSKQFLCRQLRTIGTQKAISQLESMLADPDVPPAVSEMEGSSAFLAASARSAEARRSAAAATKTAARCWSPPS